MGAVPGVGYFYQLAAAGTEYRLDGMSVNGHIFDDAGVFIKLVAFDNDLHIQYFLSE